MDPVLELVMAVKVANRELERRFARLLRPLGVTPVQAEALVILAEDGPLSIAGLGARMAADPGHPSRLADRLGAAGWIERRPSPHDGRQVELALTPSGRELADRIRAVRRPFVEGAEAALAEQGLDDALPTVRRLLEFVRSLPEVP
ncbi:MarR family winged helix-turn-helix transcriptional regulator [Actinomadura gamaensis]|uniref:MarR family winged helix-turn-helix transcriptional regulator n=1 Tax=Actinomadura gamaensis TaxID=1763541 RepID=A0ABV9TV13_9ACTN